LSKTLFVQISLTARRNLPAGRTLLCHYVSRCRAARIRASSSAVNRAAAVMVACETPFVIASRSKSASYFS
jgi:hypothetical protein